MTVLPRRLLLLPVLAVALVVLAAGCRSAGGPAVSASSRPASSPAASSSSEAPARVVYLAEGGSVTGTAVREPSCRPGCVLSGDGTTALTGMTWQTWNSVEAVGTGTERLVDCTPNCAAGKQYAVPVTVTLSRPVLACAGGTSRWFWTRIAFTWPHGLPAVFSGGNEPLNPFDYQGITAQPAGTCQP